VNEYLYNASRKEEVNEIMNDQSQPFEHVVYLRNFDEARETFQSSIAEHDGEEEFHSAADRARRWMERKDRRQAVRILEDARAAYAARTAVTMRAA